MNHDAFCFVPDGTRCRDSSRPGDGKNQVFITASYGAPKLTIDSAHSGKNTGKLTDHHCTTHRRYDLAKSPTFSPLANKRPSACRRLGRATARPETRPHGARWPRHGSMHPHDRSWPAKHHAGAAHGPYHRQQTHARGHATPHASAPGRPLNGGLSGGRGRAERSRRWQWGPLGPVALGCGQCCGIRRSCAYLRTEHEKVWRKH